MRSLFLFVMMTIGGTAMVADPSSTYLSGLFARTLGFPHVEFYEAFIVTDVRQAESNGLLRVVLRIRKVVLGS